jgi:hypothetical protein
VVKVLGRVRSVSNELAYKVMARGYTFEVTVRGKTFRIRHVAGESKLPSNVGAALGEVSNWLGLRAAALAIC